MEISQANKSLRIICHTEEEKRKLFETTHLAGYEVEFSEPRKKIDRIETQNHSRRGIIFDVDDELTNEEIQSLLGIHAERIIKKKGGETIRTNRIILYFTDEMPEHVYLGWKRFRVSLYVPPPLRCYNCQKFGHKAIHCRSKTKCPTCSGNHSHGECVAQGKIEERRVVCPNCRGNHPAYHRDCRFYQEAKSIKTIQVTKQVSYAEAAKTFRNNINCDHNVPNSAHPIKSTSATTKGNEPVNQYNMTGTQKPSMEEQTDPKNSSTVNIHQNCVNTTALASFVKSIGLLITEMSGSTKQELIAKLYETLENFVKSITAPTN